MSTRIPNTKTSTAAWEESFEYDGRDASVVLHLDRGPELIYTGSLRVLFQSIDRGEPVIVWPVIDGAEGPETLALIAPGSVRLVLDRPENDDPNDALAEEQRPDLAMADAIDAAVRAFRDAALQLNRCAEISGESLDMLPLPCDLQEIAACVSAWEMP